jgi:methionyl-tRNA formyltransferase
MVAIKSEKSILFLGKSEDAHCNKALDFCLNNFRNVTAFLGKWGDKLPGETKEWSGDFIISYLSRWIVPEYLLERARLAAFNFHPGSPDYPGIGCLNFALYDESPDYGVTCHHMSSQVDTGGIIAVKRFPIFASDDVASLLSRTHDIQLTLFFAVLSGLLQGKPLPQSNETWTRQPYTRKEFNQLMTIQPDMTPEEISRRVRATSFGVYQPVVDLHGFKFQFKPDRGE